MNRHIDKCALNPALCVLRERAEFVHVEPEGFALLDYPFGQQMCAIAKHEMHHVLRSLRGGYDFAFARAHDSSQTVGTECTTPPGSHAREAIA